MNYRDCISQVSFLIPQLNESNFDDWQGAFKVKPHLESLNCLDGITNIEPEEPLTKEDFRKRDYKEKLDFYTTV